MALTSSEKSDIVNTIVNALANSALSILDMVDTTNLDDGDYFEISGGRKIKWSALKSLFSTTFNAQIESAKNELNHLLKEFRDSASEITAQAGIYPFHGIIRNVEAWSTSDLVEGWIYYAEMQDRFYKVESKKFTDVLPGYNVTDDKGTHPSAQSIFRMGALLYRWNGMMIDPVAFSEDVTTLREDVGIYRIDKIVPNINNEMNTMPLGSVIYETTTQAFSRVTERSGIRLTEIISDYTEQYPDPDFNGPGTMMAYRPKSDRLFRYANQIMRWNGISLSAVGEPVRVESEQKMAEMIEKGLVVEGQMYYIPEEE